MSLPSRCQQIFQHVTLISICETMMEDRHPVEAREWPNRMALKIDMRVRGWEVVLIASVPCVSMSAQVPAFDPSGALQRAMAAAKAGETARARELMKEVSSRGPLSGEVQNELGRV